MAWKLSEEALLMRRNGDWLAVRSGIKRRDHADARLLLPAERLYEQRFREARF